MPAFIFITLATAEPQEPLSEPLVAELNRLLLQQNEIIEAQAKELKEVCSGCPKPKR